MASQNALTDSSTTKQKLQVINNAGGKVPATLTQADLKKDLPHKASDAPSDGEPAYTCVTQRNAPRSSPAAILVGMFQEIPRWKIGSVINFAAYAEGYPAPGDAIYAANCLIAAAEEWNSAKVGVTFKWVPNVEDAAFVLAYGGKLTTVLASAFFPGKADLETLWVYEYGFDKTEKTSKRGKFSNYGIMKNAFLHELGHVLGLRHEFAMDPDTYEGGAIVMGSSNGESVMNYIFPPQLQESDVKDTRYFYKHPLIVDYTPNN
ncbi:matrix metalloproteinase-11 [Beauveria brongniartii RCEF 3172]|uniref:Matrix metalloproteinase-11 n=1 Tax=Beauveria brongniartii RCEF 3172 TaxID=1081107 RepID=A0A167GCA1_9HYPO|nr:matrix metalloproteinase-11 [Beauveria brongniartii RCEF 3172]